MSTNAVSGVRLAISGPKEASKSLGLSIKNRPEVNYIKHNTNSEFDINSTDFQSKAFLNSIQESFLSFKNYETTSTSFDYIKNSSEDYKFNETQYSYGPRIDIIYSFENSWSPEELAVLDDIAIVGFPDYCHVDKLAVGSSNIIQFYYGEENSWQCQEVVLFGTPLNTGESGGEFFHYFGIFISINNTSYGTVEITTYDCAGNVHDILSYSIPSGSSSEFETVEIALVSSCPDIVSEPFVDIQGYAGYAGITDYGTTNPYEPSPTVPAGTSPSDIIWPSDDVTTVVTEPSPLIDLGTKKIATPLSPAPTVGNCIPDISLAVVGMTSFFLPIDIGGFFSLQYEVEYVDLSDTFLEVIYDSSSPDSVVNIGEERKIYTFGQYVELHMLNLTPLQDDRYYPIVAPGGIQGVLLNKKVSMPPISSLTNINRFGSYLTEFSPPTYTSNGYYGRSFTPIHGITIPTVSATFYRVSVSPKAGKVDIYTRKSGKVFGTQYGFINIPSHQLKDGDILKFSNTFNISETYAIWQQDNGYIYNEDESAYLLINQLADSLKGIKYVKVIDNNRVRLYEDKDLTKIFVPPIDVRTPSVYWSCIGNIFNSDEQGWGFYSTITSPCGLNGYTVYPDKRLYQITEKPKNIKLEFDCRNEDSIKTLIDYAYNKQPFQYQYQFVNSWNNYYPLSRCLDEDITTQDNIGTAGNRLTEYKMNIKNGNKFGTSIDIKQISESEYILAVGEPGAEKSFKLLNSYELDGFAAPYSSYPRNVRVVPRFLPYGRVHFYKITKNEYGKISNISYFNSVNQENYPLSSWENNNLFYKRLGVPDAIQTPNSFGTINYPITRSELQNSISNSTQYWNGASAIAWDKNFIYSIATDYQPDLYNNLNYLGFLDSFGKSVAIDTNDQYSVYFCAGGNVRGAIVPNILYGNISFGKIWTFAPYTYSIENRTINYIYPPSQSEEQIEIRNLANKIVYKDGKIFFGWSSTFKGQGNIYYYSRSNDVYAEIQTIQNTRSFVIDYNTNFGKYVSFDGEFLATNGLSNEDENKNVTSSPLDYLYIYRYNHLFNSFNFVQKLSPTIDLSNPKYNSLESFLYLTTTNYSYDRTSNNSATYFADLTEQYDLYQNSLVLRDPFEYIFYKFNDTENKFTPYFHSFVSVDGSGLNKTILKTQSSVVKISKSSTPATMDSKNVYENGQFSKSIQVFEFSKYVQEISGYRVSGEIMTRFANTEFSNKNIGTSIDLLDPSYGLNLYMATIGSKNDMIKLNQTGHDVYSSGINLFLKLQIEIANTGVNLVAKQYDVINTGINLYEGGHAPLNTGVSLFTEAGKDARFPLYIGYIIPTTSIINTTNLSIYNEYQGGVAGGPGTNPGDPNYSTIGDPVSGIFNLFIKTIPYADYASSYNLFIGQPEQEVVIDPDTGQPITPDAEPLDLNIPLNISGPEYIYNPGTDVSGVFNLYISNKTPTGSLPLFVYNTIVATGFNLYTDSKYHLSSGISLHTSGYWVPSSTMTLYQRGYVPYG